MPAWLRGAAWLGVCLALASPLMALNPARKADSYSIQGWFTEQGLPSNKIRAVTQTRDGYLWLATAQGIARFDGSRFTVFTGTTNPELRGGGFFAVLEAPDGALWFGGDNGLFRWRQGHFDHFTTEQGLAHNYVRALALTRDGAVVACCRTGYSFMRDGHITTPGGVWSQLTGVTRSFLERADGRMLLGTDDGLWQLTGEKMERLSDATGPGPGLVFTSLLESPDGTLWIGYNRGVHCEHPDGTKQDFGKAQGLENPTISDLRFDREGNLWIATYGGGLHRLAHGRIETASYPEQFDGVLIQKINESRDGALWAATASGLFRLADTACSSIAGAEGLLHTSVYPVFEASDGIWWIGIWGGGIFRYDQKRATPLDVPGSLGLNRILAFAEAPAGTIWIGAQSGLYRHTADTTVNLYQRQQASAWQKQMVENPGTLLPGIAHSSVNSIAPDGAGGLWVATDGALYHGHEGAFRAYTTADGLPGNTFKSVLRTRNGDIWVTALPFGVARLHEGRWMNFLCGEAISDVRPRAVFEDTVGSIWVTTDGGGINRFKDGRWRTFTVHDGLEDDFISGITDDGDGNLWVACSRGIMRIPQAQFDEIAAGHRTQLQPRVFDKTDGLPATDGNLNGSPSATRTKDGRLLFATDRGVGIVEPGLVKSDELMLPMYLERLLINGAEADLAQPVIVPPGANSVEINYTAISLVAPEKVRFKIRLSPLDRDWEDVRDLRHVRYDKLPPDKYEFRVIARNSDGVWNNVGLTLKFTVRPFFYQTDWFLGLAVVSVLAVAFGVYWVRVRQARRQMKVLGELVKERTQQLQGEVEERKQTEIKLAATHRQLLETSRRAGMAEVATNVLHNVGNVLNSVNVSATLISDQVRQSKAGNVARLAEMFEKHKSDLPGFLTENARGQMIPAYLGTLAESLAAEHKATLAELDHLRQNIDHIKEIVAMQQSHGRSAGVIEPVVVADLIDDALRINADSFARHRIELVRDYRAGATITTDEHKVMQIVINLVRNAKHACDDSGRSDKKIILRTTSDQRGVTIVVSDNGVGIPAENLTRIFNHGFTTRKEGHGFGLHSGALAAKELGGSLTVQSDGPGLGATFTLELPAISPHETR